MYVVILAGGGGTRLRPLSRDDRPKPFIPLIDERTLLQHTLDRLPPGIGGVWVVADGRYRRLIHAQAPAAEIIEEPQGRNTAAAIALATLVIDCPEDEVMAVLPADHVIGNAGQFQVTLQEVASGLAPGALGVDRPLVTLGVQVERAATEYGYLIPQMPPQRAGGLDAYRLKEFREKPNALDAEALWRQPGVAWNAGIFLWQRGSIRRALERYTPDLLAALEPAVGPGGRLADAYADLRTRSIDYEVMEPAARDGFVVMGSMDVGWSDIGGWTALLKAIGAHGTGRVVTPDEQADIGADDLAIVPADRGLAIQRGPSTIRSAGPAALLKGAAPDRDRLEQLLARVATQEARES